MPQDHPAGNTTPTTDFNAGQIATTVTKHDAEFIDVKKRLDSLEEKFGSNEKIADTLCETAEKATKMQEMLGKSFLKLLQHDTEIGTEFEKIIGKSDRHAFYKLLRRFGSVSGAVILLLVGAVLYALAAKYIH